MNMHTPEPAKPEMKLPDDITPGQLIAQFVKLRDRIKLKEDEQKKALAPAKEMLAMMNAKLLDMLNQCEGNSIQANAGTAYRTERTSASIQDGEAFRDYVIANELFDLIDWKANAKAVEDHIAEYETPPPGVNLTKVFTVGVRRSGEK
jgi:hypothetical protein